MSVLNNDKKVLQEGRKAILKDVDASLVDQNVSPLVKKLVEDGVGEKVSSMWDKGNSNRVLWLERLGAWLTSWDEHLVSDAEGPFAGSSNLHLPMPLIVVKTLHARFLQALLGVDPPFHIRARAEAFTDRVPLISDLMRYTMYDWANKRKGIEEVLDKWVWSWVTVGSGIIKWMWDCEYTSYLAVENVQVPAAPKFVINPMTGAEEAIPQFKMEEQEVRKTEKVFDGPLCKFIELEDLVIIGGDGDPDEADAVLHQDWLTASQMWTLADRKVFIKDSVEEVIQGGSDREDGQVNSALKTQRAQNAGKAETDTDLDSDRYNIIEAYLKYDVDGSGITSDIIVWVHKRSRIILKATYLRRVNKAGERPFKKIDFQMRNGQEYGVGMIEMLYPLSKEMDAQHNMRIDFGLIATAPFGFYRASSSLDPTKISYEPGMLIPVDNPQTDIVFPNLGNRTIFGMQEEQAIQTMVDRLTGISDLNLGVLGAQGATRTATGTRALIGESSSNLDVHLRRLNRGWRRSIEYLLHMLQQRVPNGLQFRLTGDDGSDYWRQVKSEKDIAGDFDIEVSPNSASSNKQIQQETATQIMALTSNPLDIQLQIVNQGGRYEALKNMLQSMGVKDYGRYISKPQGYQRIFTPEEMANRVLRGVDVPVSPNDDHQGFLDYFKHIVENDELLGQFNEEQTVMLAKHAQKVEAMMGAMQQMEAQAANARQMQSNAANSQQQAPVGLNPMAGQPQE